jgi:hypothetical protein
LNEAKDAGGCLTFTALGDGRAWCFGNRKVSVYVLISPEKQRQLRLALVLRLAHGAEVGKHWLIWAFGRCQSSLVYLKLVLLGHSSLHIPSAEEPSFHMLKLLLDLQYAM